MSSSKTWAEIRVGDVLMDESTGRIFKIQTMLVEHGWFTRITVHAVNVMTQKITTWVVNADSVPRDFTWIGGG